MFRPWRPVQATLGEHEMGPRHPERHLKRLGLERFEELLSAAVAPLTKGDLAPFIVHSAQKLLKHLGGDNTVAGDTQCLPLGDDHRRVLQRHVTHGDRFGDAERLIHVLATGVGVPTPTLVNVPDADPLGNSLVDVESVPAGVEDELHRVSVDL